ncbi:MAG: hypothetical protein AAF195_01030 [Pseudomonadota bacterium]
MLERLSLTAQEQQKLQEDVESFVAEYLNPQTENHILILTQLLRQMSGLLINKCNELYAECEQSKRIDLINRSASHIVRVNKIPPYAFTGPSYSISELHGYIITFLTQESLPFDYLDDYKKKIIYTSSYADKALFQSITEYVAGFFYTLRELFQQEKARQQAVNTKKDQYRSQCDQRSSITPPSGQSGQVIQEHQSFIFQLVEQYMNEYNIDRSARSSIKQMILGAICKVLEVHGSIIPEADKRCEERLIPHLVGFMDSDNQDEYRQKCIDDLNTGMKSYRLKKQYPEKLEKYSELKARVVKSLYDKRKSIQAEKAKQRAQSQEGKGAAQGAGSENAQPIFAALGGLLELSGNKRKLDSLLGLSRKKGKLPDSRNSDVGSDNDRSVRRRFSIKSSRVPFGSLGR